MNRFTTSLLLVIAFSTGAVAQSKHDVKHYTFQIEVNDSTDVLAGTATVDILLAKNTREFQLDLGSRAEKDGMEVTAVMMNGAALKYKHEHDKLSITLATPTKNPERRSVTIVYHGIPRDGFVIAKNKFGDRGFYGDNYPTRGHHWLPVIDHVSDKASVDFIVIAPLHYAVVANGVKTEESLLDSRRKLTRYHEDVDLPVKTMVVGIGRFAVQRSGVVDNIAVESWVFPQNKDAGFGDYAVAPKILDFFHTHIGPYAYKKLANVQSKTRWGGLENAGAIFYYENSVTGKGTIEGLIAHEEAHQWFGNSVSEKDWRHVWLSEGFATYFSHLYLEHTYGHDRMVEEESKDRESVIKYYAKNPKPILTLSDTSDATLDVNAILNTNSYQKGGWVLHMLRHKIGDAAFWSGIRTYYATYRNGNADTWDFERVMESASGQDLSAFFKQWFGNPGQPAFTWSWSYNEGTKTVEVTLNQSQKSQFSYDLEIGLRIGKKLEIVSFPVNPKTTILSISLPAKPDEVVLDPNTWLLFDGQMKP